MKLSFRHIRNCFICGNQFIARKDRLKLGESKFCSQECWFIFKEKKYRKEKECDFCGKVFSRKKSDIKKNRGEGFFCSRKCFIENFRPQKRTCKYCGIDFLSIPYRINAGKAIFCSRSCTAAYYGKYGKKKGTIIELLLEKELADRFIKFAGQVSIPTAHTVPDIFIEPNIVIYADGDYWHGIPKQRRIDKLQTKRLIALGYKVYRFPEYEIKKSPKMCINKIREIK